MEDKKMTLAQEMERVTQELERLHNLLTDVVPMLDNREVISEETTGTCRVIIARIHEHEYIVIPDTASTVVETLRLACSAELKPYEAAGKLRELMDQLRAYSVQYQPKAKIELRKEPMPKPDNQEDKQNHDHSPSNLTSSQTADQNPDGVSDDDKQVDNASTPQEHTADKVVPDNKSKDGEEQPDDKDGETQSAVSDDEVELEDSDREEMDFHLLVTPGMLKNLGTISFTFNN